MLGLFAVTEREVLKFVRQRERLLSAIVRPSLWLFIFATGFQNLLGVSIIEPYATYTPYQEYILPGLCGIIVLFQSMQSALSMVYDREAGVMRVMLVTPLPRSFLLFAKILAATILAVFQIYVFLGLAAIFGYYMTGLGTVLILPRSSGWYDAGLDRLADYGLHPSDRELCGHDELCDFSDVFHVIGALSAVEAARGGG